MKAQHINRIAALFNAAILSGILAGCSSAPPPAPVPEARRQAIYSATVAMKLSQAENWNAAVREWGKTADAFALIHDRTNQAIAWHNLAQAERELGLYSSATQRLEDAARLNQSLGQTNEWWRNQIVLLQIESTLDQTNSFAARMDELSQNLPRLTASELRGFYFSELAQWQVRRGDFKLAPVSIRLAETHFAQAGLISGLAAVSVCRARLLEAQTPIGPAIQEWRRALSQYAALAEPAGVTIALEGLGHALMVNQELQAADECLASAVDNNRVLHNNRRLASSLKTLIECRRLQSKPAETLVAELQSLSKDIDGEKR